MYQPSNVQPANTSPFLKKILVILSVLISSYSHSQTILIGLEGESNFVSRAKADQRFEVAQVPGAMWYKQSTNTLEPVTDPIGEGISKADNRSAAPAFVKKLKELLPNYNVIIVPSAVGGSQIGPWSKGQLYYERAKVMWNSAIAYCNANNITIDHKFIAWEQGGNDVKLLETDGYYVALNQLVNDFHTDFQAEKVFGIRIGYDPNYAPAAEAEKIMKAHKLVNFNNADYILSTNSPATFTLQNEKMQGDLVHWTLKGQNEVGKDLAEAVNLYLATGTKPTLNEPVIALQSVTNGYINLTPVWNFELNGNLIEANNNATLRYTSRNTTPPLRFTSEGIILDQSSGLMCSRPFSSDTFTIETRFKLNSGLRATAVFGSGGGDNYNKFVVEQTSAGAFVMFGTASDYNTWSLDNFSLNNFHSFKITQSNGVLNLYVDNVIREAKSSTGTFTMDRIGFGGISSTTDMDGEIDYFRITNTVGNNNTLPLKFKSFKATNIK